MRLKLTIGPSAALRSIMSDHKEKEDEHLCIDLTRQSPGCSFNGALFSKHPKGRVA